MRPELTKKLLRIGVVALTFLGLITLTGIDDIRKANQIVFLLMMVSLFALLLKNIWVTLFLGWTVFLYSFFKFQYGGDYLTNIFLGCVLYFITKSCFKREHIDFFINGFFWFIFANIAYMAIQAAGFDWIYLRLFTPFGEAETYENTKAILGDKLSIDGFMCHQSIMATVIALGIPLMASRNSRFSIPIALLMLFPLYLTKTSWCFLMGIAGLMFVLFFKIPRKFWISTVIIMILGGFAYTQKVDPPGLERLGMWKVALKYCMVHPITGWGLSSFANFTETKDFRFMNSTTTVNMHTAANGKMYHNIRKIDYWDNPHNLYVSLFFEFGIVSLFLLVGYLRQNILKFIKAVKNMNVIGLTAFAFVFFGVSFGHFPAFLARIMCFAIPMLALWEVSIDYDG